MLYIIDIPCTAMFEETQGAEQLAGAAPRDHLEFEVHWGTTAHEHRKPVGPEKLTFSASVVGIPAHDQASGYKGSVGFCLNLLRNLRNRLVLMRTLISSRVA